MKVLHVVRQYDPAIGGMEIYVKDMIANQQGMGCDCDVLTLNKVFQSNAPALPAFETLNNVKIHRVSFWGRRNFFLPRIAPTFFKKYDIVHVHNTDMFFDYVGLVCRLLKIPVFATTHGGFFHTANNALIKKIYFKTITHFSANHYRALFASSSNDYKMFQGKNRNLLLTPNAITPLGDFTASGGDFIYIGRLAAHKNIDRVIKMFAMLVKDHHISGNLHIVGPEWDVTRDALRAQAEQLGMAGRVTIHGFIPQDDMATLLKQCGYFLSASSFEGFGMSLLEGMSIGLIPFVQPNGSFRDLITQGGVGHCVNYQDTANAAKEIAAHLPHITQSDRLTARNFAAKFSWKELAATVIKAYKEYSENTHST